MAEKSEKKWSDQLYTLNLTVVALVALVAIVGLTAIVLNGGAASKNLDSAKMSAGADSNQVGQMMKVFGRDTGYCTGDNGCCQDLGGCVNARGCEGVCGGTWHPPTGK